MLTLRHAMSAPRRHHYVQEAYLRRFANDRGRIAQVSRRTGRIVSVQSVSNAAVITHFYSVERDDGSYAPDAENLLGRFESAAAPVLARMAGGTLPETDDDRYAMAMYLGLQITRGPDFREFGRRILTDVTKLVVRVAPPEYIRSVSEEKGMSISDEQIQAMKANRAITVTPHQNEEIRSMFEIATTLAEILFCEKEWNLLVSDAPVLLTSDVPVAMWRKPSDRSAIEGVGVQTADEIVFPVSPSVALLLRPLSGARETSFRLKGDLANRINTRVAGSARDWIFHTPGTTPLTGLPIRFSGPGAMQSARTR